MTAVNAAWKHRHTSAGSSQNNGPDFYGRTPANIISGAFSTYTAGNRNTISTDDSNYVPNAYSNIPVNTTGRSSHMFRFEGVSVTPAALIAISNLVNFSHLRWGAYTAHTVKTYIWNAVTLSWLELATSTSSNHPRTMEGAVASNWPDYVDGSGNLYILIWDYDGMYTGVSGCVHGEAEIHTPSGLVMVSDLLPGTAVLGWQDGEQVERIVDEVTTHYNLEWEMVRLQTNLGPLLVTGNHMLSPQNVDEKRADEVVVGELLRTVDGDWATVDSVEHFTEVMDTHNVVARTPNFFLDGGIAVNVMF